MNVFFPVVFLPLLWVAEIMRVDFMLIITMITAQVKSCPPPFSTEGKDGYCTAFVKYYPCLYAYSELPNLIAS